MSEEPLPEPKPSSENPSEKMEASTPLSETEEEHPEENGGEEDTPAEMDEQVKEYAAEGSEDRDEDGAFFQDCADDTPDYDLEFSPEDVPCSSAYDFDDKQEEEHMKHESARSLVQSLHEVSQSCTDEQMLKFWKDIEQMTNNPDAAVRLDLLEHMCVLSGICMNRQVSMSPGLGCGPVFPMPPLPALVRLNRRCIIPSLATLMRDQTMPVRKTAQCVVFRMIETRLIPPVNIIQDFLPTVIIMARSSLELAVDNEGPGGYHDPRQEAASLLAKFVQYVDVNEAQKSFLPPFLRLCNDPSFQVRRVCALVMVELCQVLGAPIVQNTLLTTFLALCEDDAWTVRKSCTGSFMAISCVVEPKLRLEALAPRFLCLLNDPAKWVAAAAYQNLGLFISTFADPKRTGLELVRPDGIAQEASVRRTADYNAPVFDHHAQLANETYTIEKEESFFVTGENVLIDDDTANNNCDDSPTKKIARKSGDINYNGFFYWRPPLPEVKELADIPSQNDESSDVSKENDDISNSDLSFGDDWSPKSPSEILQETEECGIPVDLLRHFRNMISPKLPKTIDCFDLPHNCVYSLPAVALALGPKHWKRYLKSLISELSVNVQWKVRHSLASSLHNLVIIVGDHDSAEHLLPIINFFSEDVDEIRLPLLRNLHQIIAHLEIDTRIRLLPAFFQFDLGGTERMWRIRDELATQIRLASPYYDYETRVRFFMGIIVPFLKDKVAQVRTSAALCFGPIVWSPNIQRKTTPNIEQNQNSDCNGLFAWSQANMDLPSSFPYSIRDPNFTAKSQFEILEIVLETLYKNRNWGKWQHRQAFTRVLRSIIEDCPLDSDMLEGADEATIKRATEGIEVCEDSFGIRNMTIIIKLIRVEVEELLHHSVPNVRLEVASILRSISMRSNEILAVHRQKCQKCRSVYDETAQKIRKTGSKNKKKPRQRRKAMTMNWTPKSTHGNGLDTSSETEDTKKSPEIERTASNGQINTLSVAMEQMSTENSAKGSDKSSDSDSSQDSCSRGQYELFNAIGLGELPHAFEVLLYEDDADVRSVAKEALIRFMEDPDKHSCSDSGAHYRINPTDLPI